MAGREAGEVGGADGGGETGPGLPDAAAAVPAAPKVRRARRKTAKAGKALRGAEDLGAAGAGALAELDRLRRAVDQLSQGLGAMVEAQATHTEILNRLLQAATAPTDPEHALARLLEQLVAQLDRQGGQLWEIGAGLARLPAEVGTAVAREVSGALAQVR